MDWLGRSFSCLKWKSLNLLTRLLDRKKYDQLSQLHKNLRKSTSKTTIKVRPNYDQGGQKKFLKSLFLLKGGPIQKIAYTGVNNF